MTIPPEPRSATCPECVSLADLADAIGHSVRGRVLAALCERPDVTIRQVAQRLDEPVRRVRHQVDVLLSLGLIEVTGESHRRGVLERRYGREHPVQIADAESLSADQKLRVSTYVVRLLLEDIRVAARAGTFAARVERWQVRHYGEVDEQCVKELADIYQRAHGQIEKAVASGRERVRERRDGPGIEIVAALFLFEAPLWSSRVDGEDINAD